MKKNTLVKSCIISVACFFICFSLEVGTLLFPITAYSAGFPVYWSSPEKTQDVTEESRKVYNDELLSALQKNTLHMDSRRFRVEDDGSMQFDNVRGYVSTSNYLSQRHKRHAVLDVRFDIYAKMVYIIYTTHATNPRNKKLVSALQSDTLRMDSCRFVVDDDGSIQLSNSRGYVSTAKYLQKHHNNHKILDVKFDIYTKIAYILYTEQ